MRAKDWLSGLEGLVGLIRFG